MSISIRALCGALSLVLALSVGGFATADEACQNCNQGGAPAGEVSGGYVGGHGHVGIPGPGYHGHVGPYAQDAHNANCNYRVYGTPDLFYNYYAPANCGGVAASLYVSPRPVPAHVGHTFITYQPLMPHEFMYHHTRTYHRYYDNGAGLTRTSVRYR